MIVDVMAVRRSTAQLTSCRNRITYIIDQTIRVRNRLMASNYDSCDAIIVMLNKKIEELREEKANLGKMIASLNRILEIYQKTERKNITKSQIVSESRQNGICRTDLNRYIPLDLSILMRLY